MRTSTKILIVLTILFAIPTAILSKYLFVAIVPTGSGFVFQFSTLSYVALGFQVVFNVLFGILFFRFLRTQSLCNVIFFSCFPLSLCYGGFVTYVSSLNNFSDITSQSVRATLKITENANSYNTYLWAGVATLVYLVLLFVVILFACRPLSKVESVTKRLGDGRMKFDDFKVGGGKQFKQIEHSLNKINYNFKEKDNKIRQTNLSAQKNLPKQFFKFLGKSNVDELELNHTVTKNATILFCELKTTSKTLTLDENFSYTNSYMKIVVPLLKRYGGFVDKYLSNGILAVFSKPQVAIVCAHAILRAFDVKQKEKKLDAILCAYTADVDFGIVGEAKVPTIVSDEMAIISKIQEINDFIGTKFLITEKSMENLPENFEFDYRYTGTLSLDNLQIALFESLDYYSKNTKEKLKKLKNKFENGVRFFNQKDYKQAKDCFEFVLRYVSGDKPSFVYFNKASEKLKEVA